MSETRKVGPASPAQREALAAVKAERRKPTEQDRPKLSVLPGRKVEPIPGQLSIGDGAA